MYAVCRSNLKHALALTKLNQYTVCRSNLKHALALTKLKQDLERRLADEASVHDDPDTPHIHLQCTGLVSASSSRALVQTNAGRKTTLLRRAKALSHLITGRFSLVHAVVD